MLLGVAWADRKAKRDVAEGKEPGFSWAWLIFSIYILGQGVSLFIQECIYEKQIKMPEPLRVSSGRH